MRLPRAHGVAITALAFSPSGKLAIGDKHGGLSLHDGNQSERAVPHLGAVHALTFLDDDTLVSASEDQGVRVFRGGDLATPQLVRAHMDDVVGVLPFGRGFLTWSHDGTIRAFAETPLWALRNIDLADDGARKDRVAIRGGRLVVFDARGTFHWYDLGASPPRELGRLSGGHFGQRMVVATERGIWRLDAGEERRAELCFVPAVEGGDRVVAPIELPIHAAACGPFVVAVGEDGRIWRCDVDDPAATPVALGQVVLPVRATLSLERHVLFAGDGGSLTLVGVDGGIVESHTHLGNVSCFAASPSGTIAIGLHLGHVILTRVAELTPGPTKSRLRRVWRIETDEKDFVFDMALGASALYLGLRGMSSGPPDPRSRVEMRALDDGRLLGRFPTPYHESVTLAGDRLVVASRNETYLVDTHLNLIAELPAMAGQPHQIGVAGAEFWLAGTKTLYVICFGDGRIVRELDLDSSSGQVYFDVADDTVSTRRHPVVTVWDRRTGRKLARRETGAPVGPQAQVATKARRALGLPDHQTWRSIVSSPDGRWVYLGGDYSGICIWDRERDGLAWASKAYEIAPPGLFLDGGKRIMTWSDVRDTQTGELLLHVPGGRPVVSADGRRLLTYRQDPPAAWLSDLERGEVLGRIDGHIEYMRPLVHTPDLGLIGSSCNGHVIQLHRLEDD